MSLRIVYARPVELGWNVTTAMARLMARLLDAEYAEVPAARRRGRLELLSGLLPRRRGADDLLFILPEPVDLQHVLTVDHWTRGYRQVAAWVTDAWWVDRIPHVARGRGHFDRIYVTEHELVEPWRSATGTTVECLPQGTNALDWGSPQADRPIDLQRVGRQPEAWSDDARTEALAQAAGLAYAGRPPFHEDADEAMRSLLRHLARAKFALAFSNRVSPASNTHPEREYLTGRWTDALGAGTTVAGVLPATEVAHTLLWPGATLEVDPRDPVAGTAAVREAVDAWTPDRAAANHLAALERLDWRWRAARLADDLGLAPLTLAAELGRLHDRIATLRAEGVR